MLRVFHRSTARCAFSQNSGVLPNNIDKRNAIAGVIARRSCKSSLAVWRDTHNALARVVVVSPKSGIKSSRSISPGWVGCILRVPVFLILRALLSMIICYFNIICVAINETKTDSPLIIWGYVWRLYTLREEKLNHMFKILNISWIQIHVWVDSQLLMHELPHVFSFCECELGNNVIPEQ
jgi:hypothetical protein